MLIEELIKFSASQLLRDLDYLSLQWGLRWYDGEENAPLTPWLHLAE